MFHIYNSSLRKNIGMDLLHKQESSSLTAFLLPLLRIIVWFPFCSIKVNFKTLGFYFWKIRLWSFCLFYRQRFQRFPLMSCLCILLVCKHMSFVISSSCFAFSSTFLFSSFFPFTASFFLGNLFYLLVNILGNLVRRYLRCKHYCYSN